MEGLEPTAGWTTTQPWRGLFGVAVTLGIAFTVTASFDMQTYLGFFTTILMSNVPILLVLTMGLQGQYPSTEGLPRPWGAFLKTALLILIGLVISHALLHFVAKGAATPFIHAQAILTVIVTFFLVIAFGMWPFDKMSLAAKGFLTLICAYIVAWLLFKLFNFSLLSHPDGIIPSAVGAVPFYAKGGPLEPFAALAPMGPVPWEVGLEYAFSSLAFLFVFIVLGMWPFHKFPGIMKQPTLGIVLTVTCCVLGLILHFIGVAVLKIAPLMFFLYCICYLFGLLMLMTMFQMWPGRTLKSPLAGGFLTLILAAVIGSIAYFVMRAFCASHFGADAFKHPADVFSMGNLMLGITFPIWAAYSDLWDFWPLPPTPPPPPEEG
jgi:hypothetical protein